jgi:hypothetical protein
MDQAAEHGQLVYALVAATAKEDKEDYLSPVLGEADIGAARGSKGEIRGCQARQAVLSSDSGQGQGREAGCQQK